MRQIGNIHIMMKKTILFTALLLMAVSESFASNTFFYKFIVRAQPTGSGKVYASNKPLEEEDIRWRNSFMTERYDESPQAPVAAVTVTAYLYAKPEEGYMFNYWSRMEGNNEIPFSTSSYATDIVTTLATDMDNPLVTEYYAHFSKIGMVYPKSSDETLGTVSIDIPENEIGQTVTITANPDMLCSTFKGWRKDNANDLITTNPLTITVDENTKGTYVAEFESKNVEDGIYVRLSNINANRYMGVIGKTENTLKEEQRYFVNSLMFMPGNHANLLSTPAVVIKLKGKSTGAGGLKLVEMIAQGVSTYELGGMKLHIEKYLENDYFIFGQNSGFTGYIKDNFGGPKSNIELIGTVTHPSLYNRPNAENNYRWRVELLDEEHMDQWYFGAKPSSGTALNGKYYTTLCTAFPYQCYDGVKAYIVDKILRDGRAHLVELKDGIVPANTAVLLECNSTEVKGNRLLPLTTEPAAITTTNLLKGEIWVKDENAGNTEQGGEGTGEETGEQGGGESGPQNVVKSDDASSNEQYYRTAFDPQTMRILSTEEAAFGKENIKDPTQGNITLTYIANNTCYLDVSGVSSPKASILFTTEDETGTLKGDANGDGQVNVSDIMACVNYILENNPTPFIFLNADTDNSGKVNVSDIMWIVNYILNK